MLRCSIERHAIITYFRLVAYNIYRPQFSIYELRKLLLRAGYVRIAVNYDYWSRIDPRQPWIYWWVEFHQDNPYPDFIEGSGIRIDSLIRLLPEMPCDNWTGAMALRKTVLQDLHRFEQIKRRLRRHGKDWFSINDWYWHFPTGRFRTFLNPYQQKKYKSGRYSLKDLELWAREIGPIVKTKITLRKNFKRSFVKWLKRH